MYEGILTNPVVTLRHLLCETLVFCLRMPSSFERGTELPLSNSAGAHKVGKLFRQLRGNALRLGIPLSGAFCVERQASHQKGGTKNAAHHLEIGKPVQELFFFAHQLL